MADEVAPAVPSDSSHKWFLSLDCECTGRIVPSGPNGELEPAPIFAIGCAIGGFNKTTGALVFVPGRDLRLSFPPAANQYDASTREFWDKKNQQVLTELSVNANCVDEQDLMGKFWTHWNMIVREYPGITVVSDCQAFDIGYLLERVRRFVDPLAPMMTMQPLSDGTYRFVNTYDAGTLEKNTRAMFGQAVIDAIYEAAPVKHTHDPLDDAINTLYMMHGCSKHSGFSLANIDRKT